MFQLGKYSFDRPLVLAPMDDITDLTFRRLCVEFGADMVVTEFVNSDGLTRNVSRLTQKIEIAEDERPVGIQVYGQDLEAMVRAAKISAEKQPDFIDINAGCWIKKISMRGAGAGLMKDPEYLAQIAAETVKAVSMPVTVKTRLGWDDESINICEIARRLEDAGISMLTVHMRTRSMGHSGEPRWEHMQDIKKAVSIPIILNGGVINAEDVKHALETTEADGVMIARGAVGRPWVFREAKELLEHGEIQSRFNLPFKIQTCLRHLKGSVESRGERRAVPAFRKYYTGYLNSWPGISQVRRELMQLKTYQEVHDFLMSYADSLHSGEDLPHAV